MFLMLRDFVCFWAWTVHFFDGLGLLGSLMIQDFARFGDLKFCMFSDDLGLGMCLMI